MAVKVISSIARGVAQLTLNRAEARNALDTGLIADLQSALRNLAASDQVRACVLTGAGTAFCAGADLKQRLKMTIEETRAHTDSIMECANMLEALPVPVIAAVNGPAFAGGLELAVACDLRIASRAATFAVPEITIGIFPGAGGPVRLPRLVGRGWAKLLVLAGERVTAEEAHRIGLVEKLAEPETLMAEATALAERIATFSPEAVRSAKLLINQAGDMSTAAAMAMSAALRHPLSATPEAKEALEQFSRG